MDNKNFTGWLSPYGDFIECESYEHLNKAEEIAETNYSLSDDEHADDVLYAHGWASITIRTFLEHGISVNYISTRLTDAQLHFLKPYLDGEFGLPLTERSRRDILRDLGEIK